MLVVPVPEVEAFVVDRTIHYDRSFLSADPAFTHAHLTLLGPWLAAPTPDQCAVVATIAARWPCFDYQLARVASYPDGTIHLAPESGGGFEGLTAELVGAFPQCPPYAGRFPGSTPHVTLERVAEGISVESVRAELAGLLPVSGFASRIDLQWWDNDDCHVMASWPLGEAR